MKQYVTKQFVHVWKRERKNVGKWLTKINCLKKKKKQEGFKENEEVYWKRLGELNKQFKANKKAKKKSETIIKM